MSDQDALNSFLLPDLKKIGVDPQVVTITADVGETASTDSDATLAVERLKEAGVQSVIPLLPENAFTPYIGAETSQNYFPKLLLSDYQSEIEVALGLIPIPYEKALNGQEGVTAETLGGIDLPVPEAQGGYDPGVRSCWTVWHKAYPQTPKGNINDDIEEQGPVQGWCQEIRLFAKAATMAGKDLNRRTFVEAMSHITNFPGRLLARAELRAGQVLGPHAVPGGRGARQPPADGQCKRGPAPAPAAGVCWVVGAELERRSRGRHVRMSHATALRTRIAGRATTHDRRAASDCSGHDPTVTAVVGPAKPSERSGGVSVREPFNGSRPFCVVPRRSSDTTAVEGSAAPTSRDGQVDVGAVEVAEHRGHLAGWPARP